MICREIQYFVFVYFKNIGLARDGFGQNEIMSRVFFFFNITAKS